MQNFEYELKISFMILWNFNGAFFNSNDITLHSIHIDQKKLDL